MKNPELFAELTKISSKMSWLMPNGGTILIVLLLIATQSIWAKEANTNQAVMASTNTISYQGQLTDSAGNPLNGTYNMVFKLYTASSGGTALWTEPWTGGNAVDVTDGLFHVLLGSLNNTLSTVVASNNQLYLGITVGTDSEMLPRVQLGSTPFAFQANRAYGLSATNGNPADAVYVDANGYVGIGTINPVAPLHILGTGAGFPPTSGTTVSSGEVLRLRPVDNAVLDIGGNSVWGAWLQSTNELSLGTTYPLLLNPIGGNVGIGTTNPGNLLHIHGPAIQLKVDGSGIGQSAQIAMVDGQSNGRDWRLVAGQNNSGGLLFSNSTNGIEALAITPLGNVGIGITNPTQPLQMGSGAHVTVGGMWTNASDRALKENFAAINPLWYLEQVVQLPLSTWNYKTEGSEISHVGPMAQDFYAAFGLGEDDKHIGTVDANGVTLAAIQGLYQLTQDQQAQIES